MRETSAGSCATILCSAAAEALGSSTVATILAVTSGRVAIEETLRTASRTRICGSRAAGAAVVMRGTHLPVELLYKRYRRGNGATWGDRGFRMGGCGMRIMGRSLVGDEF